jgi:hypothetical protein
LFSSLNLACGLDIFDVVGSSRFGRSERAITTRSVAAQPEIATTYRAAKPHIKGEGKSKLKGGRTMTRFAAFSCLTMLGCALGWAVTIWVLPQ